MKIISEEATVYRVVGIFQRFMTLDKAIEASIVSQLTGSGWGATAAIKVAEEREEVWKILNEHMAMEKGGVPANVSPKGESCQPMEGES
jgi:hypothetical protein